MGFVIFRTSLSICIFCSKLTLEDEVQFAQDLVKTKHLAFLLVKGSQTRPGFYIDLFDGQIRKYLDDIITQVEKGCSGKRVFITMSLDFIKTGPDPEVTKNKRVNQYSINLSRHDGHTVVLLVDEPQRQVWLFDPNGQDSGLDNLFERSFLSTKRKGWSWISLPCPRLNYLLAGGGLCTWFSCMFVFLSLDNPRIPTDIIFKYMLSRTKDNQIAVLNFISRVLYLFTTTDLSPFLLAKLSLQRK